METSAKVFALWAIDPTEQKLRPSEEALQNIRHFLGGGFNNVHPTYIYTDEDSSKEEAQEKVSHFLAELKIKDTLPSEVFWTSSGKRSDWAKKVLDLAHEQKDEVILLTSHGRSSIGAVFLGSFVWELLQQSDLPLIIATHRKPVLSQGEKVLFATDFSNSSQEAFQQFLRFVKGKTSQIILCHVINFPLPGYNLASASGVVVPIPDYYLQDQKDWADKEAARWIAEAKKMNLDVHLRSIVEQSMESSSKEIEAIATKENVGLVGLASHVGPFERVTLGSVTQDLLAAQKFNLWICGPHGHK